MNDSSSATPPNNDLAKILGQEAKPRFGLKLGKGWMALIAVAVIGGWFVLRPGGGPAKPVFTSATATQGELIVTVTATGTLQPRNQVEVGPEISGQIDTVNVDFNASVKKGDILAAMDTDNLTAKVLQARASLASARAKLDETRATVQEAKAKAARVRDLFGRGNASKQELDAAEAAENRSRAGVSSAEAQIAVADANLTSDETNLAKAAIKSPIDGVVLSRKAEPGQVVAATFQTPVLFTVAEDLTKMELLIDIDEADIGQVNEGQAATFTVDAYPDRQFPAEITQVRFAPKSAESVVTYQSLLSVDNQDLSLRPGMTATAVITTATRGDAILVPNAALRFTPPGLGQMVEGTRDVGPPGQPPGLFRIFAPPMPKTEIAPPKRQQGGFQRVWIEGAERPSPVDIKVGLTDGQVTEVVSGDLKPGQKVIVAVQLPKR